MAVMLEPPSGGLLRTFSSVAVARASSLRSEGKTRSIQTCRGGLVFATELAAVVAASVEPPLLRAVHELASASRTKRLTPHLRGDLFIRFRASLHPPRHRKQPKVAGP